MIIIKYNSPKDNESTTTTINSSGSSFSSSSSQSIEASRLANVHKLWGQDFNGTQDVTGDITGAGNIASTGNITVDSLTDSDGTYGGNITAAETIKGKDIEGTTGTITTINSTTGNITNVKSTDVNTNTLEATTGTISTLSGNSEDFESAIIDTINSTNIKTDYLTVSKKAHFFELDIDEIKSVGGQVILTPANATIDIVETTDTAYRCYFKSKDGEGKQIYNQFVTNDQVICQTFNGATGTSYNVSNKYYWRLITGIGKDTKTINGVSTECHYIDISKTDCDTDSSIPEVGDKISQLGNRSDTTRQAAIIISAYASPDSSVTAPSIVQYSGINDYALSTHKLNQIAKNGNIFKGEFYVSSGQTVEDYVKDNAQAGSDGHTPYIQDGYWYINGTNTGVKAVGTDGKDGTNGIAGTNGTNGKTTYLHIAYSTSSNGQTNFSTTWFSGATYIGVKTDYVEADSTTYSDYDWSLIKGDKGDTGTSGKGISSITNYWLATSSSSGVTTSTSGWSTSTQSVTATNKYLWTYQVTVYTTGTTETVSPHIVGTYGDKGDTGTNGTNGTSITISSTSITYQTSTSGTTTPTGTWSTTVPTVSNGNYLWTKTVVTYSNAISTTAYSVSRYGTNGTNGTNGSNGTSVTVTSTSVTYSVTTTSTQPADSTFTSTTVPTVATGNYLWSKTTVTYSDGKSTTSYSVSRIGSDGSNGTNGTNGTNGKTSYLHIAYANSSDGSSGFSTTYFSGALYIGTYTDFTESDSTTYSDYTWARLKGQDGTNGTNGTNGSNGADAEFYKLIDNGSYANVDSSKTLSVKLNYGLTKIKGNTSTTQTSLPTGITFRWSFVNNDLSYVGWNSITFSSSLFSYSNTYSNTTNRNNIEVQLLSNSVVIETIIIPVVFTASASFSVTDSINATVTGHTTTLGNLDTRITTNKNNISSVDQKADNIQSTVSSHTTSINTINGKLSTDESNISTLQQTSTSLTSKVLNMKTSNSNYFGFSKGINFGENIQLIQCYGYACKYYDSLLGRISNLGFDGATGTFVVAGQIKMKSSAATININLCDVTAENNGGNVSATTSWQDFMFVYNNVSSYNTPDNYNGFLDVENLTNSVKTTNYCFIKNLRIYKGNVDGGFTISESDAANYGNGLTINTDDYALDYSALDTSTYLGMPVYKTSSTISAIGSSYYDYIHKDGITIEDNSVYTLSFYAKSASGTPKMESYFYGSSEIITDLGYSEDIYEDGHIKHLSSGSDGYSYNQLSTTWKKYTIHWYVRLPSGGTTTKNVIVCRLKENATVYLSDIRFEKGFITDDTSTASSLIKQTADNIELKVKNTGINIDDGTITLDADKTVVKGKLQINEKEDGTGLLIIDSDGIPRIDLRCDTMADMTNIVNGNSSTLGGSVPVSITCGAEIHSRTVTTKNYIILGNYSAGDILTLSSLYVSTNASGLATPIDLTSCYNIYVQRVTNNTTVNETTKTYSGSYTGDDEASLGSYSLTVTTSGTYRIYMSITYTCTTAEFGTHPYSTLTGINTRTPNNEVIIAKDGLAVSCGTNKWLYASTSEIELRWGNNGLKLSDTGIQQYYPNSSTGTWSAIGRMTTKYVYNTTWTLDNVVNYIVTNGTSYIIVPATEKINGRSFTITVKGDSTQMKFAGGEKMIPANNKISDAKTDTTSYWYLDGNVGRRYTYVADVNGWFEEILTN